MIFISKEQEAVVKYRVKIGYECEQLKNGFWLCFKGRHKMIVNGCGWDTYTGIQ